MKNIGSAGDVYCKDIHFENGHLYHIGNLFAPIDFDPDTSEFFLTPFNKGDAYVSSLDSLGRFRWAFLLASDGYVEGNDLDIDAEENVIVSGAFERSVDFDPGLNIILHDAYSKDASYTAKYAEKGITGYVYSDVNQNCTKDISEKGLQEMILEIQPGNLIVQTSIAGTWYIDSLPAGTYEANVDTSENWKLTCTTPIAFTITNPAELTTTPGIGLKDIRPCTEPEISVFGIGFGRCAPNQVIQVRACNLIAADKPLINSYVLLILDNAFTVNEMSVPYTSLGENNFRIDIGTLLPGQCVQFHLKGTVDCDALLGQTICTVAYLFPVDSCALHLPETPPAGLQACAYEPELSDLELEGWCNKDSIFFKISNTGPLFEGDMNCFSMLRLFMDGDLILIDSIQLKGGEADTLIFSGDGRTWRLEADQHPLHIGRSKPNVTVELCGNSANWSPQLGIILPQDDEDPVVSLYCDVVRGPYDPNDKTGFPSGVGDEFEIAPDSKLEYRIRFQNTGNDTALTVIVRDTLDEAFTIFSIQTGASSHPYRFKTYGPRVLEWIFDNIQLPDSNSNENASHGFVSFSIDLKKGVEDGTQIFNRAGIYFDANDPVLTNYTMHTVSNSILSSTWADVQETAINGCKAITYNGIVYSHTGTYWQLVEGNSNQDTLLILELDIIEPNLEVGQINGTLVSSNTMAQYQWVNCEGYSLLPGATAQDFTPSISGSYAVILDEEGCIDTSNCNFIQVVSVEDDHSLKGISLFPNPTYGRIIIDLKKTYKEVNIDIVDITGRLVQRNKYIHQMIIHFNLDAAPGLYFVQVWAEDSTGIFSIVKL